jgi:hypothetical protein
LILSATIALTSGLRAGFLIRPSVRLLRAIAQERIPRSLPRFIASLGTLTVFIFVVRVLICPQITSERPKKLTS